MQQRGKLYSDYVTKIHEKSQKIQNYLPYIFNFFFFETKKSVREGRIFGNGKENQNRFKVGWWLIFLGGLKSGFYGNIPGYWSKNSFVFSYFPFIIFYTNYPETKEMYIYISF